jgi:hypothetical protein
LQIYKSIGSDKKASQGTSAGYQNAEIKTREFTDSEGCCIQGLQSQFYNRIYVLMVLLLSYSVYIVRNSILMLLLFSHIDSTAIKN